MGQNRIPSFFRIAKHQSFHIEPRYYDPVKEEIEDRERMIRAEMKNEKNTSSKYPAENIRGSFRRTTVKTKDNTALLRLLILGTLLTLFIGYWYIGNKVIYILLIIPVVYFIFRKLKLF